MPLYDVECSVCGSRDEIFRSISNYNDLPTCCEITMNRLLSAPTVIEDIKPYRSMVDGSVIESRSAHRNHLKQHRMIEIGNEKPKPRVKDVKAEKKARRQQIAEHVHRNY